MIPIEVTFPSPVVADDGACDGQEVPFDGRGRPAWCPVGEWPPAGQALAVASPWAVSAGAIDPAVFDALAGDLAALDNLWRASFLQVQATDASPWSWRDGDLAAGLRWTSPVRVGVLEAGATCEVWARHGELWAPDCAVAGPSATLKLYPAPGPGVPAEAWLVTVTAPLAHVAPVTAVAPIAGPSRRMAWLGWAAAAGAAIMVPAAYAMGKASMLTEAPPPPVEPVPLPGDPFLRAQVALLGLPPVREAAQRLVSALPAHARAVTDVIEGSRASRAARPGLPAAYAQVWEAAEAEASSASGRIQAFSPSLAAALADPEAFLASASPEVVSLWRSLFPATEAAADGAALAHQLTADVLREAVFAPLALAQLVGEAVPQEARREHREVPGPGVAVEAARIGAIAAALGWRYEHVALYERFDADFLLDDATVTGVPGEEVLLGLPIPAEARPGVIVRVRAPVLRPPEGQPGLGRAHLLSWRAP